MDSRPTTNNRPITNSWLITNCPPIINSSLTIDSRFMPVSCRLACHTTNPRTLDLPIPPSHLRLAGYLRPIHDAHRIKALSKIVSNSLLKAPMTMKPIPSDNKRHVPGLMGIFVRRLPRPSRALSHIFSCLSAFLSLIYCSFSRRSEMSLPNSSWNFALSAPVPTETCLTMPDLSTRTSVGIALTP